LLGTVPVVVVRERVRTLTPLGPDRAPSFIASADFNADGTPDLAVVASGDFALRVLMGEGDGMFSREVSYWAPSPDSLLAADINGDGYPDLIAAARFTTLLVLLNHGDGTFDGDDTAKRIDFEPTPDPTVGLVYLTIRSVASGDFNGDGHLDLAVAGSNNLNGGLVKMLLGNGDGTFQQADDYVMGYVASSTTTGDFNTDGKLDLALVANGKIVVALGDGNGGLEAPTPYSVSTAVDRQPGFVVSADFNEDGTVDLAFTEASSIPNNPVPGRVGVMLGTGDGTFPPPAWYAVGDSPWSLVVGDFSGDGTPDLVTADQGRSISVLIGTGDGTYQPAVFTNVNVAYPIVADDFDVDGKLDLAIVHRGDAAVAVLLGRGDGQFAGQTDSPVGGRPGSIVSAELNGDGKLDLVVADLNTGGNGVLVLLGAGDGSFLAPRAFRTGITEPSVGPTADFNGDGKIDLVVTSAQGSPGTDVAVLFGTGDGGFADAVTYPAGDRLGAVGVGDFNGDGKPDLIINNRGESDNVRVLINTGSGFGNALVYSTGRISSFVAVADFDGDGNVDALVGDRILFGNGAGGLVASSGDLVTATSFGDFNQDGKLDLTLSSGAGSRGVIVRLGSGNGSFQNAVEYPAGGTIVGDFNGDGKSDLVGAADYSLRLLIGNGDGIFQPAVLYPIGSYPTSVIKGDFDGDGRLDIVTSNAELGIVTTVLNWGCLP
jgi:hypothetical protein